ncbi:MAG: hypothetical protein ACREDL_23180, partial [Bradyrhizobium sp.]
MPVETIEPPLRRGSNLMKAATALLLFHISIAATLIGGAAALAAPIAPRIHHSTRHAAGRPGQLLRIQRLSYSPFGAAAYRVLYTSLGLNGRLIPVSGVVVVPSGPAPRGGRNIVAWAHPTTGIDRRCAPSLQSDVLYTIPGLETFLARGDIVTATDYP